MTELAWLFPYLLFLHILGAIAGFGPSFAFPIVGAMGGKEREHGNFATRVSETISNSRLSSSLCTSIAGRVSGRERSSASIQHSTIVCASSGGQFEIGRAHV